jgi:hypothetical protein
MGMLVVFSGKDVFIMWDGHLHLTMAQLFKCKKKI